MKALAALLLMTLPALAQEPITVSDCSGRLVVSMTERLADIGDPCAVRIIPAYREIVVPMTWTERQIALDAVNRIDMRLRQVGTSLRGSLKLYAILKGDIPVSLGLKDIVPLGVALTQFDPKGCDPMQPLAESCRIRDRIQKQFMEGRPEPSDLQLTPQSF